MIVSSWWVAFIVSDHSSVLMILKKKIIFLLSFPSLHRQFHALHTCNSTGSATTYIFWALSSTYNCICGTNTNTQTHTTVIIITSCMGFKPVWLTVGYLVLHTLTISEVIVFSGMSLGSCMCTSCSSATIQGKSWRRKWDVARLTSRQPHQTGLL